MNHVNGKKKYQLAFSNLGVLRRESEQGMMVIPQPRVNVSPELFVNIQTDETVSKFMKAFAEWNIAQKKSVLTRVWQKAGELLLSFFSTSLGKGALDVLNDASYPYINLQESLAAEVEKFLKPDSCIVDLGCGRLDFIMRLIARDPSHIKNIKRIFAVDIDDRVLHDGIYRLLTTEYNGDIALIQAMSGYALPIWDDSIDICFSSLGASMYAFVWINGQKVYGKDALRKHLQDVYRFLKPGGIFAISSPKPNPDWSKVFWESLLWPLKNRQWKMLLKTITYGLDIRKRSSFMTEYAKQGYAHYLSADEWSSLLQECGFEIIKLSEGEVYAGQGVIVIAQKKNGELS